MLVVQGQPARSGLVLVVVTLDVFAFRAAKRMVGALEGDVAWEIVVNKSGRARIVPSDVERVFGKPPFAIVPADRRVPEAQDRGELLSARSRTGRVLSRLAARIVEDRTP